MSFVYALFAAHFAPQFLILQYNTHSHTLILTTTNFLKGPDPNRNDVFILTVSTVYAIEPLNKISNAQGEGTPQTWVVRVIESNSGRVQIVDPMTGQYCENLSEKVPNSLNLLDYRVTEIGKFYRLDLAGDEFAFRYYYSKVLFSSFLHEHDDEFAVMATYKGLMELGMWRNVDQKWSHIDIGRLSWEQFADIIYHNDNFYVLLTKGRTVTVDPKSLIVTQVAADLRLNGIFPMLNLVGSFDDLFLVAQYPENNYDDDNEDRCYIEVSKLNEKKRKWVLMDRLDFIDRVLFVGGIGNAFSVSVKEFPRFKGGCIYYMGMRKFVTCLRTWIEQCNWICDFCDGKFGPILAFPGYLNFFWPPTAWLNDRQELMASAGEEKQRSRGDKRGRKISRLMPCLFKKVA